MQLEREGNHQGQKMPQKNDGATQPVVFVYNIKGLAPVSGHSCEFPKKCCVSRLRKPQLGTTIRLPEPDLRVQDRQEHHQPEQKVYWEALQAFCLFRRNRAKSTRGRRPSGSEQSISSFYFSLRLAHTKSDVPCQMKRHYSRIVIPITTTPIIR